MTDYTTIDAYGQLIEPATLRIERLLPGPVERAWAWLTESDLRRQWLAAGEMDLRPGAPFTLTWNNDKLTDPPSPRASGETQEHSMTCTMTEVDPPHMLGFQFGTAGHVRITLEPQGSKVLLTLIHDRVPDRDTVLKVSAGWHQHLDTLVARANGRPAEPFWPGWDRLHSEYAERFWS